MSGSSSATRILVGGRADMEVEILAATGAPPQQCWRCLATGSVLFPLRRRGRLERCGLHPWRRLGYLCTVRSLLIAASCAVWTLGVSAQTPQNPMAGPTPL